MKSAQTIILERLIWNMNRTPKVRQKKSNFWGAIFMKLSYEDKIEIYELRQSGQSIKNLSKQFNIAESVIQICFD